MPPRFLADMGNPWRYRQKWGGCERTSLGRKAGEIISDQCVWCKKHLNGAVLCWKHGVKCRRELRALHVLRLQRDGLKSRK